MANLQKPPKTLSNYESVRTKHNVEQIQLQIPYNKCMQKTVNFQAQIPVPQMSCNGLPLPICKIFPHTICKSFPSLLYQPTTQTISMQTKLDVVRVSHLRFAISTYNVQNRDANVAQCCKQHGTIGMQIWLKFASSKLHASSTAWGGRRKLHNVKC